MRESYHSRQIGRGSSSQYCYVQDLGVISRFVFGRLVDMPEIITERMVPYDEPALLDPRLPDTCLE